MDHHLSERALAYFDELFPLEAPVMPAIAHQPVSDEPDIVGEITGFDAFGTKTVCDTANGIPYFINEFWTSGQRRGHSLHEISYRACFKPQLPEFFISRLTSPGDAVYDPFMGRGTTLVQAALQGRRPIGNDVNPLSTLLVRPRLNPPHLGSITAALANVPWGRTVNLRDELLVFYHTETLRRLTVLREYLFEQAPLDCHQPDPALDWIRMVAINRLTGHSPGFFSVYTLPPNQAVSVESQRRINERRGQKPEQRDIDRIILKKTKSLLADGMMPIHPPGSTMIGQASCSPAIPSGEVSLVVTSPPFLDIVQYAKDNWLRCWFAGIDTASVQIDMLKNEAAWTAMVRETLRELARVVRPNGHVAFEVGEVRGGKVLLERLVWKAADGLPFDRLGVMVNQQEFTKTANCWGVNNNNAGTNTNRIVLLRRS